MTTEHLHPLSFLLMYKFTPAQTINLPFADLQIPILACFLSFSPTFHVLSKTLPFFLALTPALLALPLVFSQTKFTQLICWAHLWSCQPTRNIGIISGTSPWFLPRWQFLHWFTRQGGLIYLTTCVTASSHLHRLLPLDLQLSWMVPLLWVPQSKPDISFLHFNTFMEQVGCGSSFPQGIHHHLLQLYFFIDEENLLFQVVLPLINLALITHLTMHAAAGLINFMVISRLFMVLWCEE